MTPRAFVPWFGWAVFALFGVPAYAQSGAGMAASEPIELRHPMLPEKQNNAVHCLLFLNGGKALATGDSTGVVRIWDVSSRAERHALRLDERGVDTLAVDPCGTILVAGGASGLIRIWDILAWKEIRTLDRTSGAVRGLCISPDGKTLASASPNGSKGANDKEFGIILWDILSGKRLRTLPLDPPALGMTLLSFAPDGKSLISGQDRTIRAWDPETGKEVRAMELPGVIHTLGSLALRGDGRRLATGVFERKIRIWDLESWSPSLEWNVPAGGEVLSVAYSPDGTFVLSGQTDGAVGVWDAATGQPVLRLRAKSDTSTGWPASVTGVVMSPDGGLLAASTLNGSVTVWRMTAREANGPESRKR